MDSTTTALATGGFTAMAIPTEAPTCTTLTTQDMHAIPSRVYYSCLTAVEPNLSSSVHEVPSIIMRSGGVNISN